MKALIRQHRTFPALFLFLRLLMVNVVWKASGSAEEPTTIRRVIGPSIYNQSGTFRGRCEGGGGGGGGGGEVLFLDAAVLFFGQSTGDCPDGRCPVDVTVRLSELCSARSNNYNNCEVPVRSLCNDTSCATTTTTTTTTQASLNVTYSCLRVVSRNCRHKCSEMSRLTDAEGYLTGDTGGTPPLPLGEGACGTSDCPWQIQVQPGQNIEVSLYHLGGGTQRSTSSSQRGSRPSSNSGDASCFAVRERANPKEFQDCVVGGARARQRVVYTTVSNTVQLRLTQRQERFLLHYRATGCPDIVPPYNSRMKRTGDRCEIDCPGSDIRWTLTCEGNRWAGTEKLDKCPGKFYAPGSLPDPQRTSSEPESAGSGSASSWPMSVLITAVVAVTVIIAVLVLTIGFVLLKKHQYEAKLGDPLLYGAPTSEFEFCTDFVPVRPGGGSAAPPRTATARSSRSGSGPGTRRSLELLGPPVVRGEGTYYAGDRQLLEMQPLHRPLPMIPAALGGGPGGGGGVDGGRTGSWRPGPVDPKKIMVQLHRTGSGTMSVIPPYPTMMMRDGRLLPCNCGPQALSSQASIHRPPSHLYFTLDPEIQVEEPATLGRNYPAIEQGGGGTGGGEDRMNTMPRAHQQRANASPPLPPPPPPAPEMVGAEVNQRAVLPPPPPPEDMSHMEMIPLNLTNPTRARQQAVAGQIQDAGQTPLNLTPPHRKSTSSGHEGQQQQQGFRQKSCVEAHS